MSFFRKLATKPWLEQDTADNPRPADIVPAETAKVGLFVFLAVITFLFFLFFANTSKHNLCLNNFSLNFRIQQHFPRPNIYNLGPTQFF